MNHNALWELRMAEKNENQKPLYSSVAKYLIV